MSDSWIAKAAKKRESTLAKIPSKWILHAKDLEDASKQKDLTGSFIEKFFSDDEREVLQQNATSLVDKLTKGEYTAKRVTVAFCKAAAIAHQINNCLHEIFFDQAILRAEELDEYFSRHGVTSGPLHGLPISLKDQFHVKGNETTMGYIGWIDTYEGLQDSKLAKNVNSQIVSELLDLGAVLYCKTSLPQTLLLGETVNNLIGRTLNPHNQKLSCGGSSGGEGALLALRGSPVGLGTDIAGSVRIPSAFNGIFAIKPTHTRLSYRDVANSIPGQTTYASSIGVMSTSIDAIQLVMKSILSTKPWLRDPIVTPFPWRQEIVADILSRANEDGSANDQLPLKFGIFWTDNVVSPHPPISRGLRLMVDSIQKAGHKVVEWKPPSHTTPTRIHATFLRADGGYDMNRQLKLSGEPLIPDLKNDFTLKDPMSLLKYQQLTVEGRDYEASYSDYWNSTGKQDGQVVDAIIMPVAPHAAVIPGKYYHNSYTQAINLMDYSAIVLPVTRADKDVDKFDSSYSPLNDLDAKNWNAYDPEIYDGAPVGLQIVGRKFEEEKIWAIGKIVYEILCKADIT